MKSLAIEQPRSLTQLVVERVRQAIVGGEFSLGENISEEKLATSLGVSRTPVRDALTQLQLEGLVVIHPKRGSFVFTPTLADVESICEYRLLIELNAIGIAHQKNKDVLIPILAERVAEMEPLLARRDHLEYGRIDTLFHQAIIDCCDNSYIVGAHTLVAGRVAALRTHVTSRIAELNAESFEEHRQITALLGDDDVEGCRAILRNHIGRTREVYLKNMVKTA